jgi:hypothetical protein
MTRSSLDRRAATIRLATLLALLVLVVAGCAGGSSASPSPQPEPSSGCGSVPVALAGLGAAPKTADCGTPAPANTAGQLRLLLIDQLGPRWYCDPDEYPVARFDEQQRAIERYPEMVAEGDTFSAVASQLGIDPAANVTDSQKRAIYHLWKAAVSIPLDPIGNGQFRFDYTAQPVQNGMQGTRTVGTVAIGGAMSVEEESPAGQPPCPICLSVGTRIDTPDGPIAVEALRLGDPVWTLDVAGRRVAGTVIALGSTPAPAGHQVVRLVLQDGRSVTASPGHPLPDGRPLGDLRSGDEVDGSRVVSAALIRYAGADTYDLVASGPTGAYFAGGIPLGSTLR